MNGSQFFNPGPLECEHAETTVEANVSAPGKLTIGCAPADVERVTLAHFAGVDHVCIEYVRNCNACGMDVELLDAVLASGG